MESVVHFLILLGFVALGLWLGSLKWKSLKPVLKIYLAVLRVSALGMLYLMYYMMLGIAKVLQGLGKARFGKGGRDVLARNHQPRRRP